MLLNSLIYNLGYGLVNSKAIQRHGLFFPLKTFDLKGVQNSFLKRLFFGSIIYCPLLRNKVLAPKTHFVEDYDFSATNYIFPFNRFPIAICLWHDFIFALIPSNGRDRRETYFSIYFVLFFNVHRRSRTRPTETDRCRL